MRPHTLTDTEVNKMSRTRQTEQQVKGKQTPPNEQGNKVPPCARGKKKGK